jgi:hypothetical protein
MTKPIHTTESLTIEPTASRSRGMIESWLAAHSAGREFSSPASRTAFRAELGLPLTAPLVMTGHQAELWHAGILAKYLAADAFARSTNGGSAAWLVVDQDDNEAAQVPYPRVTLGASGEGPIISRAVWNLGRSDTIETPGLSTCFQQLAPTVQPPRDAAPEIAPSLARVANRLNASQGSAAQRLASTLSGELADLDLRAPAIFATSIARTSLFRSLLRAIESNPERCLQSYNAAVRAVPDSGMTQLLIDEVQDRYELPLWHLPPNQPRRRVYLEDLATIPIEQLAPRALFMTAILRLAACDLFIHGLGGGLYDRVTELWISQWLPAESLAPTAVVTATRFLPLADGRLPTDSARARWAAHRALHDPALLGDPEGAAKKRQIVNGICALPRNSSARRDAYRHLHELLTLRRSTHASALDRVQREAARAVARAEEDRAIFDRSYPFSMIGDRKLRALKAEIDAAFGV